MSTPSVDYNEILDSSIKSQTELLDDYQQYKDKANEWSSLIENITNLKNKDKELEAKYATIESDIKTNSTNKTTQEKKLKELYKKHSDLETQFNDNKDDIIKIYIKNLENISSTIESVIQNRDQIGLNNLANFEEKEKFYKKLTEEKSTLKTLKINMKNVQQQD